jgi:hypothetical protein
MSVLLVKMFGDTSDFVSVLLVLSLKGKEQKTVSKDIQLMYLVIHAQVHDSQESEDVGFMIRHFLSLLIRAASQVQDNQCR